MPAHHSRTRWTTWLFFLVLAVGGSLAVWYWPQSPHWRLHVPNPDMNRHQCSLHFFSEDSQRVFISEADQHLRNAAIAHYDAHTGKLIERVELWNDRTFENQGQERPFLTHMPSHHHRSVAAVIPQPNGSQTIEYYDVNQGGNPVAQLIGINQVAHVLSRSRRWVQYFLHDLHKTDTPYLIITNVQTGEVVLTLQPEGESSDKSDRKNGLVYGWMAVFDPTERYVALEWNTAGGRTPDDPPDKHQSQIRIYDLQTKQEVRRIQLPPGYSWSVRYWEGDQLWVTRSWIEHSKDQRGGDPFIHYSSQNRIDLTQDKPQPIEYPQFGNLRDRVYLTRGSNWLAYHDIGLDQRRQKPLLLRKLIDWFPSLKDTIDEYYPEWGFKVWLADITTGERQWECPRYFYGSHAISPDGQWLALSMQNKDATIIEVWQTHTPKRWLTLLGYLAILAIWFQWRRTRLAKTTPGLEPLAEPRVTKT